MKKVLLFAAIAVFGFTKMNAQDISYGVKAGVNFSSFTGDTFDDVDGRTAFHAGILVDFKLDEKWSIQPEALYSIKGVDDDAADVQLSYISVPILAKYRIIEGLSVELGPQLGFLIDDDDTDAQSFDFGGAVGAEYDFPFGLFIQARYNMGFTDVYDVEGVDVDAKNSAFQVSVGYMF